MADKKRDILEFVEQSNFEQMTPTHLVMAILDKILLKKEDAFLWIFYSKCWILVDGKAIIIILK